MRAIVNDDMVVGLGDGIDGVEVPHELAKLPPARLRYVDGRIVDVGKQSTFYIGADGVKHAKSGTGRNPIKCNWDARLKSDEAGWSAQTDADVLAPRIKAECSRRINAIAGDRTQINMLAAAMMIAGQGAKGDKAMRQRIEALWQWIGDMRSAARAMIAAADANFARDDKWPAPPDDLKALADQF